MNPISEPETILRLGPFRFYRFYLYSENGPYMYRWIFRHPWGTVRLHHIMRSDSDRDLHDHPFDFTSIILSGSYREITRSPSYSYTDHATDYYAGSVIHRYAEDRHRLVLEAPVWTLVFTGPNRRAWGYKVGDHWIHNEEYRQIRDQ